MLTISLTNKIWNLKKSLRVINSKDRHVAYNLLKRFKKKFLELLFERSCYRLISAIFVLTAKYKSINIREFLRGMVSVCVDLSKEESAY